MTLINWTPDKQRAFTKENLLFTHNIADSELFSEEALIALIDRYPRDSVEVFTMGYDQTVFGEWYLGRKTAKDGTELDGRALMEAVKHGRLWLNLRRVNHSDPAVGELCERIFAEVAEKTGTHNLKTDLGLLISSPNAHVVYHLDMPMVMLWQIRGVKKVYLYPADAGFFTDRQIEGIALRESDENLPYDPAFDDKAMIHDLKPGEMLTWPQNAPHRIVNGDMVNVSLSIEFMTPAAIMRANLIYANGVLRRRLGARPRIQDGFGPTALGKLAVARGAKALNLQTPHVRHLPVTFGLDARRPGVLVERV